MYEEKSLGSKILDIVIPATITSVAVFSSIAYQARNDISIKLTEEQREEFKKGSGDPAELYKIFAEQVDPLITAGGQSATVEVTVDGDVTLIQHAPKKPLVLEPSGS